MRTRSVLAVVMCLSVSGSAIAQQGGRGAGRPEQPGQPRQPGQPGLPGGPGQPREPGGPGRPGEGQPGGDRPRGARDGGFASTEQAMQAVNRGVRRLRASIEDAGQREENLRVLGEVQRAAVFAKSRPLPDDVPAMKEAEGEAARARLQAAYHRGLLNAVRKMLDVEQDLLDRKFDAAKAHLDELVKMRDEAHHLLGVDRMEEGEGDRPAGGRGEGRGEGRGQGRGAPPPPPAAPGGKPEDVHPAPGN
jgi:hypothetical protein